MLLPKILKKQFGRSRALTLVHRIMPDSNALKATQVRVAIVIPSLAAYRVPVFNRLSQMPDVELEVIFAESTEHDREWDISLSELKFKYTVLPTVSLPLYTARGDQTAFHLSPR